MSRTLTDVLVERERLLARGAQQRLAIANACRGLAGPAAVLDRIGAGGRYLVRHPGIVAGVVLAAMALRGRSLVGLVARGIGLWRLAQRFRAFARLLQR
jgi:hypothetical protein